MGGYITGNTAITLTAYNSNNNVPGSQSTPAANYLGSGTGYLPNIYLSVSAPNIAYVTFHDTGDSFTLDDFSLTPAIQVEGSLTNFNMVNNTGSNANNFEIALAEVTPSEITGFYTNPNYGNPTITTTGTGVLVTYANPQHPTAPGATEHFGVRMADSSLISANTLTTYWTEDSIASPTMAWPTISSSVVDVNGVQEMQDVISLSASATTAAWVQRSANWVPGAVAPGNLMPTDPIITGATLIDPSALLILPGEDLTLDSPIPNEAGEMSRILAYDVYGDDYNLTLDQHTQGAYLSTFYDATVINTTAAVPEPTTLALLGSALLGLGIVCLRRAGT